MKLVTWDKEGIPTLGALAEDRVVDLPVAYAAFLEDRGSGPLEMFPEEMNAFLEAGDAALDAAKAAISFAEGRLELSRPLDLSEGQKGETRLRPPVPAPRKLFCLATNYQEHMEERGTYRMQKKDTVTPRIFMKPPSTTLRAHGEPILISPQAQWIDWEGELAIVIGKRGKYIPRDEAMGYVAGYSCLNDVSERALKIRDRVETDARDAYFDWLNGKWMDSFAPMGPVLVTADEISDPHDLELSLWVNGKRMQHASTGGMIFDIPDMLEYLSCYITLEPGDVIATGTPSGVGRAQGIRLEPGDVVRLEIEGIGVLENPVEAEEV